MSRHFEVWSRGLFFVDCLYIGDSDLISVPAGFRRHLVGNTLRNVFFHRGVAEIRFVGKLVIMQTFS